MKFIRLFYSIYALSSNVRGFLDDHAIKKPAVYMSTHPALLETSLLFFFAGLNFFLAGGYHFLGNLRRHHFVVREFQAEHATATGH